MKGILIIDKADNTKYIITRNNGIKLITILKKGLKYIIILLTKEDTLKPLSVMKGTKPKSEGLQLIGVQPEL
jgi:hypothetical protein